MVNIGKLKGKIVEKGFSVSRLANEIEINKATLYRKLSGDGDSFTIGEVDAIVKVLNLDSDEARDIFFSQTVA